MKKKVISSVLATALTISLLPMVTSAAGGAIEETDGGVHYFPGTEYDFLEITGGVSVDNGSQVNVDGDVGSLSDNGIYVGENGGYVNVTGDVTANSEGVWIEDKGVVNVGGNVTAEEYAVEVYGESTANIAGSASGSSGVAAGDKSIVTVKGSVTGTVENGVEAFVGSSVKVEGDIVGVDNGVFSCGGQVYAGKDVTGGYGVHVVESGNVSVTGTAKGTSDFAVCVIGSGNAAVSGNAEASGNAEGAVYVNGNYVKDAAVAIIEGSATGGGCGVYAIDGGKAVIGKDVSAEAGINAFGATVVVKGSVEGGITADEAAQIIVGGDAEDGITVYMADTVVIVEGTQTGGVYNSTSDPGAKVYIGEFGKQACTGEDDVFYLIGLADGSAQWSELTIVTNTLIPDMTEIRGVEKSYLATLNVDDVAGKEISFKSADASNPVSVDPDTLPAGVTMTVTNGVITLKFDSSFKGGLQDLNIEFVTPEFDITNGTPETDKATNNGFITIDKTEAAKGETVTVTVEANEGYLLDGVPSYTLGGTKYEGKQGASANEFVFEMPEADIEIKASFAAKPLEKYKVSFNMNGHGSPIDAQTVEEGNTATEPKTPAESGWVFDGWYSDALFKNAFDFGTKITQDTVLFAKWSAEIIYKAENSEPLSWEMGSTEPLTFVFHRNVDDDKTCQNFEVAGKKAELAIMRHDTSGSNYTTFAALNGSQSKYRTGSLIFSIEPSYLQTLPAGKYKLTVYFTDGSASAEFRIKLVPAPDPAPGGNTPKTGDTGIMIYVVGMIVSAGALGVLALTKKKKEEI